jgi:ATP-dependent DNA helicase RecQ
MANRVIANCIREKIENLNIGNDAIVVLKGIPLSIVDDTVGRIDLSNVVSNKLGYFMSIFGHRQFLTFEEFLLLADFIVAQYKEIYILNNNIYMEQFPVEECFPAAVRAGLLTHFDESDEGETDSRYIGDIDEYVSVFEGLKEYNGYLMGAYCSVPALRSPKVITVNVFENSHEDFLYSADQSVDFIEIIEESDYINFVKLLFAEPDEIYVRITNYTGDANKLKDHIALIYHYWQEYTEIFILQAQELEDEYSHRDDYCEILSRFWGYPSFRNLPVYDMAALERGEKVVKQVSQESIIANLVEEVENCGESKDFRDVFVTAPTGAGKSVMFQVPAIYLAEKYNLLTIVISPLIGLMNDQVKNLELKNYSFAKTINSDISPIIKQDIIEKVSDGQYHILYLSPETLLSRSDVEQLIGDRTIGMIVIDEAHIVTTWGKQFRPDYWYLGDHIRKLRKQQLKAKGRSFVIGTFTATAIYHGLEDMYTETINSLHILSPITYLGYVKRGDIEIIINRPQKPKGVRAEYEWTSLTN